MGSGCEVADAAEASALWGVCVRWPTSPRPRVMGSDCEVAVAEASGYGECV